MEGDGTERHLSRRRFLTMGAAVSAGVALAGCSLSRGASSDTSAQDEETGNWSGTLLSPPLPKPDVTFTDFNGKPFPFRAATEGKLTLLFFGYTHCPDVCPVTLNTLAGAREGIGTGPGSSPQVLFVGVDVARDTPAVLKEYLGNIDDTFIGLTASEHVIAQAIRTVKGAPVQIEEADADGEYAVGHPAQITVFTADDKGHRIYPAGVRQAEWVRDLPRLDEGRYR